MDSLKLKMVQEATKYRAAKIEYGDGHYFSLQDICLTPEQENEFARRLVAAYNACEGISTETLESEHANQVLTNFASTVTEMDRLKAQNAQLLDAIKDIHKISISTDGGAFGLGFSDVLHEIELLAAETITEKTETP